jgi:hypothetical protein
MRCPGPAGRAGSKHGRIGRITREHGDVEFWVERIDADRYEPGTLDGMPVPAMSVSGMLAMKAQFPVRQPALRAWKAAISAVISSAARCRGRPSVVNASVTGPSVASTPVSKCSVPM